MDGQKVWRPARENVRTVIQRMILREPNITVDEIEDRLKSRGLKTSRLTVSTIRADFRRDLRFLKSEGLLKERSS